MDDYFVYLLKLASYLGYKIIHFKELLFWDIGSPSHDPDVSFSGRHGSSSSDVYHFSCEEFSMSSTPDATAVLLDYKRRFTDQEENLSANRCFGNAGFRETQLLISQWFMLPMCGLKLSVRLTSSCLRSFCKYVIYTKDHVCGFICRVRTTLQGSSEDIGWLQRSEGLPPVVDGTGRFMEVLHDIRNGEHCLPNTLVYLLIPGLFSNLSPLYFLNTKRLFSKMGLTCHIAKIHSEASVEKNARELKEYIEELYWGSGKSILLLGHSKGGVDAAAALALYWSDLKDKVAGLALVQSPYGGTPVASDVLREGQICDKEARRVMEFIVCKLIKGDMRALEDLTYDKRRDFISKHRLPVEELPLISFHTEASIAPGVIATMSHIAHAEIPWLPLPSFLKEAEESLAGQDGQKVPVILPVAATMAVYALHLKLRYGESSDGMVTRNDAEVPGSVVVRPQRKLDHGWMVYSTMRTDQVEADATEMCEALLTMLVEIGERKKVVNAS